ncbi:MAG: M23 family metallopeptidase [Verrucomicrobia bacterium]|nr:M23 family metallopeptidase [Verrucomicrobiota bacterium]MDA1085940.1 M23 family metallopeptidase [Verrucomicrobiota bacterium]
MNETDNETPGSKRPLPTLPWDADDRRNLPPMALRVLWLAAVGCLVLALATLIVPRAFHRETSMQPAQLAEVRFPTAQIALLDRVDATVFQPTSSGRPESGLYGSVRSYDSGLSKFHEGIDIAPLQRDRRQRPLDPVYAVADGKIVYINRSAGRSSYGKYIVLEHADPVGGVYTLYAHLATVDKALREAQYVAMGRELGIMGNTSTLGVPVSRSHLHFEVGLLMNTRFGHITKTPHGIYDGRNLIGLDPIAFFGFKRDTSKSSFGDFLAQVPPAFTLVVKTASCPDYFQRYSGLWSGEAYRGGPITIQVSEGGVPLQGRHATPQETSRLGKSTVTVLSVDEAILGRNARRLVTRKKGNWETGVRIDFWMQLLTHSSKIPAA